MKYFQMMKILMIFKKLFDIIIYNNNIIYVLYFCLLDGDG